MLLLCRGFLSLTPRQTLATDANQLCLEQHHMEFYFLGAFIAPDVAVRRIENGAVFVLPSRLNGAFEALVSAGLDLALDPRVSPLTKKRSRQIHL